MISFRLNRLLRSKQRVSGFSLIELLSVMAIMSILLYLAVPVSTSFNEAGNLAYAGQTVADQLAVARQYAASLNQTVYVRFIVSSSLGYKGYTAIQICRANNSNPVQYIPVDRIIALPAGIEISAQSTLSPLVSTLVTGNSGTMPAGSNVGGSYVYFTVRPDGNVIVSNPPVEAATDTHAALDSQPSYFLTLVPVRYDTVTTLPKNYVTIQLNPDTGNTQIFRP